MVELALPEPGSYDWYDHYRALHHRVSPYAATVFRTDTRTIAVDRYGQIISDLATTAANNSTVIQAAIDAVAGTYNNGTGNGITFGYGGGGTVKLADQFFAISTFIDIKWGICLEGSTGAFHRRGAGAATYSQAGTVIAPTAALGTVNINLSGTTTKRPVILFGRNGGADQEVLTNPHGCAVRDLTIDARQIPTAQCVLIGDSKYVYIERIRAVNASGSGGRGVEVASTRAPDFGGLATSIEGCVFANCQIGVDANGSGSTDSQVLNSRFSDCINYSARVGQNGGGGGWQFHGNHFEASTSLQTGTDHCHLAVEGAPFVVSHNYFEGGGGWHIFSPSSACTMTGNFFKMSNTARAPIRLRSSGRRDVVYGNVAQGAGTDTRALVQLDSGPVRDRRTIITGNIITSGTTNTATGAQFTGIACTDTGAAIAEADSAMNTVIAELDTTANPYIWGNRLVLGSV